MPGFLFNSHLFGQWVRWITLWLENGNSLVLVLPVPRRRAGPSADGGGKGALQERGSLLRLTSSAFPLTHAVVLRWISSLLPT